MCIFSFSTRVAYDDIDQNRQLTLKGAMGYMQEAAIIHSGMSGYSVDDVERTHVCWMLVQWRAKMVGTAHWNDSVVVQTWPRTMERATSSRNFELLNSNGETVAIGESNWVLINTDTGRIKRITPEIASAYTLHDRDLFTTPEPPVPTELGVLSCRSVVQRRDIDTNHHVNNRVYLDYAREALPEELAAYPFKEVMVRYRQQLLPGQPIQCFYHGENGVHTVHICGDHSGIIHCVVTFLV